MSLGELPLQNIVDDDAKIFRRRHRIREFRPHIQILQIKAGDNFPLHAVVEGNQIADHAVAVYLAANCDRENIIVAVAVRVITLAVSGQILSIGHLLAMQPVGGREAISAGEVGLHSVLNSVIPTKPGIGGANPQRVQEPAVAVHRSAACYKPEQQVPRLR